MDKHQKHNSTMRTEELMFALLRAAICEAPESDRLKAASTQEKLDEVYALANSHDLAHLVGQTVSKLDLSESESLARCKQATMRAFMRYMQTNYCYEQICTALENAQIPFLPLKGAVIRDFYPEPWMRTSCDIDILVQEEELERAIKVLVSDLGYRNHGRGYHDVSLFSPANVHVELHFSLLNEVRFPKTEIVLDNLWKKLAPAQDRSMQMHMPDELYYFYHILHMASHFCNGGCGIRPLLDLWILNYKVEHDAGKREALLRQGGLLPFGQAANALSEVWFSGQPHTELTEKMEAFILDGGVYGTAEAMTAVRQSQNGGRLHSIFYKIFLPYDLLKGHYPILQKHKWLTPFCQVARWFRLLSGSRWKRSWNELKTNFEISTEQISSTADLLKTLGL